ncbi:MAG: hypothetical protein E6K76_07940 [Candidatus Eisenbacteria bacterium]|uniref:Uncharacterized protein n=1 Tax=Eiseniibacteriota bacterium TaxID=2212470 RepID=A0A538T478_UNCEI|nr:MAG: hypothetical protein E6K76_07940 [Candidatus Eisenbacteria bacterium]
MFIRGVNLGAGTAGHFPGEFAITKADYRRWLRFARALHANAIRVYALHPPDFYQALKEENEAHPREPLWLFQEVWTELPERNDFWDPAFIRGFDSEIKSSIDAIHGNAVIPPRPGHAAGRYAADVSPYVAGWLLGREWEPYAVRVTQRTHPGVTSFRGTFFSVEEGTPMECWLGRELDLAASYEADRYGLSRAVSFVNWPTLDVMRHPTETEPGGHQAEHDEDAFSVDPGKIRPIRGPSPLNRTLGYFANYHVYPYYPDFMNLDPGYSAYRDKHGACNYAGYLADLKAHTRGIPLLIGEFGVPTSRGIAHLQPQGINHGGMSEEEQGRQDVRLVEDIQGTGCAGALLFALFDEWFKVNWLVMRAEQPRDRDPLWHNLLDPEESYGLIGFDPPSVIHVDGNPEDWAGIAPYATAAEGALLRALYVTSDQNRFYVRIDLAEAPRRGGEGPRTGPAPPPMIGVSLDVLDPKRGDRGLPRPLRATWSRGAEFVLLIDPGDLRDRGKRPPRAELFIDKAMNYSVWSRVLVDGRFESNTSPFRPVANVDGRYIPLIIETNRERVSRSGKVYPSRHLDWGRLELGREPSRAPAWPGGDSTFEYDPHAEWAMDEARETIEIALPWGLLNVGDPSSRAVLDDKPATSEVEVSRTEGIGLLAWATRLPLFRADSLGPARTGLSARIKPGEVDFLGPPGTAQGVVAQELRVTAPESNSYVWKGWEMPMISERIKKSAKWLRDSFEGMDAREQRNQTDLDAKRE